MFKRYHKKAALVDAEQYSLCSLPSSYISLFSFPVSLCYMFLLPQRILRFDLMALPSLHLIGLDCAFCLGCWRVQVCCTLRLLS